jgi:hypothetical protein
MASTYEPEAADFVCLEAEIEKWGEIFKKIYKPLRHKIFAHKDLKYLEESHLLFSKTNIGEIEGMLCFLHAIDRYVWELLHNGRRYNLNEFIQDEEERVLLDVKTLLESLRK